MESTNGTGNEYCMESPWRLLRHYRVPRKMANRDHPRLQSENQSPFLFLLAKDLVMKTSTEYNGT
ncbi:hypothetical protein DPMN_081010 [Dreissena polymorpha]|uniref:Uncharacterized protein n=1 Tax=Dreissena polymorpha TaxID=45954 RepID=A0A9D3Y594_DREPO|nr:hypothetical protein DPMN_080978 [Dreissena polymorpha]KAH3693576.1 hypothetical protein DPMN_081010 [Dreissena polymorpha]